MASHDSGHPFDSAYSIMKGMQGELNGLREQLNAEKKQRNFEVCELTREVQELRAALAKQQQQQSENNERVSCALHSETALRGRTIEKLRSEVQDAIHRASEVESMKKLQNAQFNKIHTDFNIERQQRDHSIHDLDARVQAEVSTRTEQCGRLETNLAYLTHVTEINTQHDRERMGHLHINMQRAGQLLSSSQGAIKPLGESMQSTAVGMLTTAGSSPQTTSPQPFSASDRSPQEGLSSPLG